MPAIIDTPFFEQTANYAGRKAKAMPSACPAERVARTIVNLIRAPRREVVVGPMRRALVMQAKVAPGLTERMMAQQVGKTHLYRSKPAPASDGILFQPRAAPDRCPADGTAGARPRCAALPPRQPLPAPLTVTDVDHFLATASAIYPLAWI